MGVDEPLVILYLPSTLKKLISSETRLAVYLTNHHEPAALRETMRLRERVFCASLLLRDLKKNIFNGNAAYHSNLTLIVLQSPWRPQC